MAERSGDDHAVWNAQITLGLALLHRPTDAGLLKPALRPSHPGESFGLRRTVQVLLRVVVGRSRQLGCRLFMTCGPASASPAP
jgi:hypothetical protein